MKFISSKNALTLVEVLVAVIVFSIGIVGVLTLFPLSVHNIQVSQDLLIVAELASSTISFFNQPIDLIEEAVKNSGIMAGFMPIKDIDSNGEIVIINSQEYFNLGDDTIIEHYIDYQRAIEINVLPADSTFAERHEIIVIIRWNDSRGRSRTFRVSGILYPDKALIDD